MAIGGVVINFAAKTADAVRDIGKLDKSLDKVSDGAKKGGSKFGKFIGSMSNSLPVVGAVIGAAAGLAGGLISASKAALEDKKSADRLAHTLSNIPGITQAAIDANEAWITSMQIATLVSDTELRDAIGKLTLATGDLGEAQELAALSADVATGSGKSYATVAAAMAKAASGNTAQLERMFPWLDKNKDGTVTLTEAQKGLGKAFGGAAEEAAKNDPWKRIAIIWDEIQETLGSALLPLIEELGDWFGDPKNRSAVQKLLAKFQELADTLGRQLLDAFRSLVKWLQNPANQQKLKDWGKSIGDVAASVGSLIKAIQTLLRWWDKLPQWSLLDKAARAAAALANGGPSGGAGGDAWSATPTATATATAPAPAPPPVIVTEEQVYRAVQRLLLKGQARNGRLVVVG
jgi:hypothetical protein